MTNPDRKTSPVRFRASRTLLTSLLALGLILLPACGAFVNFEPKEKILEQTPLDQFVDVDGVTYHYRHYPGGGEPVLLIHGFGSSTYTWESVAPVLRDTGYDVWAVDMQGFGWTDKPRDRSYAPSALMEGVAAWMEAVGLEHATFVGNSLGGEVSLYMTLTHPEKVDRLIVVDPRAYPGKKPFIVSLAKMPGSAAMSKIIFGKWMVRWNLEEVFYDKDKIGEERIQAYYDRLRADGALFVQTAVAKSVGPEELENLSPKIPEIEKPTLILWGEDDHWIPVKDGKRLHEEIANSRLVILPQCGHVPQEEKPGETAEAILDFMQASPIE